MPGIAGANSLCEEDRSRTVRRSVGRIAATLVLVWVATGNLQASDPTIISGPTIQRSMRVVPRRYVIEPSGATVAADQTQRFSVVDANGKPVAVRWNISGLGCYGGGCGSIDEQGLYRPPASLPKLRVITLEGVVVSDPHFSVLTQIHLEEAKAEVSGAVAARTQDMQPAAPALPKVDAISGRTGAMSLPTAIDVAPTVTGVDGIRAAQLTPLPAVIGVAPTLTSTGAARPSKLAPVPDPVAAVPQVTANASPHTGELVPLPPAVVAAPPIANAKIPNRVESMPMPRAVDSVPSVGAVKGGRNKELPLKLEVGSAPAAGNQKNSGTKEVLVQPSAVAATPAVASSNVSARTESKVAVSASASTTGGPTSNTTRATDLSAPRSSAAPAIASSTTSAHADLPPVTTAAHVEPRAEGLAAAASVDRASSPSPVVLPAPSKTFTDKAQPAAQPVLMAAIPTPATGLGAQAMPVKAADKGAGQAQPQGQDYVLRVTYRGGQLTIDARNVTLAQVLKAVAEKIGATIDLPPGTGLEPIVDHAGPGNPNEVLTELLNGSRFNFILVSSPQHPEKLAQVLLSLRPADEEAASVSQTPTQSAPEPASLTSSTKPSPYHPPGVWHPPAASMSVEADSEPIRSKLPQKRDPSELQNPPQ